MGLWQRAVVDRIVDEKAAVILVGDDEIERVLPIGKLPEGVTEGSWLRVWFSKGDPVRGTVEKIESDLAQEDQVRERIARKMDLLKARGRRGR